VLTRANLASNAAALVEAWRFTSRDIVLHTLPLFHIHACSSPSTPYWRRDRPVAAAEIRRRTDPAAPAAGDGVHGVPTHYTRLLQLPALNREATIGMRLFVSGSAPLPAETHREFAQRTGHAILERYGMTETLIITSNPVEGLRKPGSVGAPLPGIAVRVAREASGAEAHAEVGSIEVKGPNVFAGYWQDPGKTRDEFTADGWFKTGDLGYVDGEGYVHIVGRAKDLVISGGYNVYPKEVETELDALPGVLESAVFGVPHPDLGEGVTAAVVLQPAALLSEADIIDAIKARLARYKVPKRVLLIEELPRNPMGKVQKNRLRAAFASLYGSKPAGPAT